MKGVGQKGPEMVVKWTIVTTRLGELVFTFQWCQKVDRLLPPWIPVQTMRLYSFWTRISNSKYFLPHWDFKYDRLKKYFDPIVPTSLARLEETMQLISLPTLFATKIIWMVNKMGKKKSSNVSFDYTICSLAI